MNKFEKARISIDNKINDLLLLKEILGEVESRLGGNDEYMDSISLSATADKIILYVKNDFEKFKKLKKMMRAGYELFHVCVPEAAVAIFKSDSLPEVDLEFVTSIENFPDELKRNCKFERVTTEKYQFVCTHVQ